MNPTAKHVGTSSSGLSNWYQVNIADLTSEMREYFVAKANRDPLSCKIDDETIRWCTQFNGADFVELVPHVNKQGLNTIIFRDVLNEETRMKRAAEARALYKKPTIKREAAEQIDVDDVDL